MCIFSVWCSRLICQLISDLVPGLPEVHPIRFGVQHYYTIFIVPGRPITPIPYHWIALCRYQLDDMAAGARRIFLRPEHVNTITDIVCIAEKELVATSSLDRRVCVWQVRGRGGRE